MIDWEKLKNEYVTEGVSYGFLAKKYQVGLTTVQRRGTAEGWVALRKAREADLDSTETDRARRLQMVADKLLDQVERALDEPEQKGSAELKNLSGTLKTIKEIQMIRSSLDDREQRMKIAAMEKQLEKSTEDSGVVVELEGQVKEWAN